MAGNQYALSGDAFRALAPGDDVHDGETVVSLLPARAQQASAIADRLASVAAQLRASDWAVMPDSGLGDAEQAAWLIYRAALRRLPDEPGFPDCSWPVPPTGASGNP